ncbi:MAG: ribonuclease PH [Thermodesulfobacteriota bacterium]
MGVRSDGRRPDEMRRLTFEGGVQKYALGSVLVGMGDTKVLCAASLEDVVPPFLKGKGRGWVTAEYGMLPASTEMRIARDGNRGRSMEIQRLIGRSLRAVTDLRGLGERTIRLDCDVIQADGGTRTAAITGGFLALVEGFRKMKEAGQIHRLPIKDQVAAVSVGMVRGELLLDLNYAEDAMAEVDANLVMTGSGDLVEVQCTGEEGAFSREQLNEMLDLAWIGIRQIHKAQLRFLGMEQGK